ncbi:hypothetical protein [Bacillus methanolicus]|uniref:LysM domain-containing protein n=1 Tax=Bacillus methanolicus (strain MGA3 / ATCC 53907) TaxID=796606 RepID=I3EAJ6_BACMM|nr:hypothetical protein [Bacillus methanolicus]AIE60756.1 hypothetical protein BMMGA3_11805 [Bacillus methanolicus MGA3]EIJ83517.1 hypothetical protein MGA3_09865 [Bacillus methanolicus MGA3]
MKRLFALLAGILVIYVIYYDLNHGTLPSVKEQKIEDSYAELPSMPYFEKQVQPGDTVLSIVENRLNGPIPVSISKVVEHFQLLNDGKKPEDIQVGKTYRFPDYNKKNF